MITAAQAQQYLDGALGVGVPSFIVEAAVAKVAPYEQAMVDAGYSDADRTLIQAMTVSIIAAAGAPRRISSQTAASGAGRSFKNFDNGLTALRRSLASLDTKGVTAGLVGVDPVANTLFMVVC